MGQISIPAINKTGYSMYWNSMWDDKNNFARSLKEDIYIRKFIPAILEDNVSFNFKNFLKNIDVKRNYINDRYNLQISSDFNQNNLIKYLKSSSKVPFYLSKIWIFKYQTWILIFFYVYTPSFYSALIKNEIVNDNLENFSQFNILNNYYFSVLRLVYKYNFFKTSTNKNLF